MYIVAGGGIGKYMALMAEKNPEFDLLGIPYPSIKRDEPPKFLHQDNVIYNPGHASITSKCKTPELAMAWLDYSYSKEGYMLANFGIEGVSYNMENGYPKYTELITKNPDDIPMSSISFKYFRVTGNGPFVQDHRYIEQYLALPQQVQSLEAWTKFASTAAEAKTALKGTLTTEEASALVFNQNEINTYVQEQFIKFILGTSSLDDFDQYVERIKQMGIDDIIKAKQNAHDKFMKEYPNADKTNLLNIDEYYNDIFDSMG